MNPTIRDQSNAKTARARVELPGLLAMRCYAAMAIVLFHLIALPHLQVPPYLSFISTHFGFGVPLFYTVSAFGLFAGYAGRIDSLVDFRAFYLRRFFRIAPLFYFMIAFYCPLFWLLRGTTLPISHVISSVLFIFNFIPEHVEGIVMASWSIGVEMAFYAILPLLVFAITGFARSLLFLAVTIFLAANWALAFQGTDGALARFSQLSLMAHLFYFAGGIAAYFVWLKLRSGPAQVGPALLAASLLSIIAMIYFADKIGSSFWAILGTSASSGVKTLWAVTLAGAVVGVCLYPQRWFVNSAAKVLGTASFSIYLWHPIVIVILNRLGFYQSIYAYLDGELIPFLFSVVATFTALIPLSLLSYRFIERPGMALSLPSSRIKPA